MSKPKTLIVKFTPRGSKSRTLKLLNYFLKIIENQTDLTILDLDKTPVSPLTSQAIQAYYKRNYEGQKLTTIESNLLKSVDIYRDQLLEQDFLIISSPMYNFGYPAVVKAWIDSVMQKGYVYDTDENGHIPKLQKLKVLIIYSAGLTFDQINENENWNGLVAEGARLFEYMGASEVRVVHLEGADMLRPHNQEYRLQNVAYPNLNWLAKKWFGVEDDLKIYN